MAECGQQMGGSTTPATDPHETAPSARPSVRSSTPPPHSAAPSLHAFPFRPSATPIMDLFSLPLLLVLPALCYGDFMVENSVMAEPKIDCLSHMVAVNFVTQAPFQGHVFIRGHYADPDCHKDYVLNRDPSGFMDISFDKCGMRRQRTTNPKGMTMSAIVVVSFHRTFITMHDKSYHLECFYLEEEKVVQSNMHVSELQPTELSIQPPMPSCVYSVLSGGPKGEAMSFARVGDTVYHKWSCSYPTENGGEGLYCMVIHSCTVDDGETALYEVVDKEGCQKDPVIMGEIEYNGDLMAGTAAQVFKFADKAHVYFTCQVKLSLKSEQENGVCPRPECNGTIHQLRYRRSDDLVRIERSALRPAVGDSFDILSKPVLVLDLDDPAIPRRPETMPQNTIGILPTMLLAQDGETKAVCVSELSFGFLVAAAILSLFTAILFALVHYFNVRTATKSWGA
uniref:ZP domain-containing protein n=1 Tax=Plectus sambesii TaxID=2011161 RepID=A0A914XEE0_9BILA